jgi:hypothetical protein
MLINNLEQIYLGLLANPPWHLAAGILKTSALKFSVVHFRYKFVPCILVRNRRIGIAAACFKNAILLM